MNSIFSNQKKLINIISKESARDRKIILAKYNKLMQSRQTLVWMR